MGDNGNFEAFHNLARRYEHETEYRLAREREGEAERRSSRAS